MNHHFTALDRRHPLAPYQSAIAALETAAYCTVTLRHDVRTVAGGHDFDCDRWIAFASRDSDRETRTGFQSEVVAESEADGPYAALDRLAAALGVEVAA